MTYTQRREALIQQLAQTTLQVQTLERQLDNLRDFTQQLRGAIDLLEQLAREDVPAPAPKVEHDGD